MSDPTSSSQPHVGYILKQYPRLSETFIVSEILGLEDCGVDVSIFSLRHATEGRFHPAIASVQGTVRYVANPDRAAFLNALRSLPELRSERLPDIFRFIDRLPAERRSRLVLQAIEIARAATGSGVDHLHAHFLTVAAHTAHLVHLLTGLSYSVTAHAKDIYRHTVDWDLAACIAADAAAIVTVCDANLQFLADRIDGPGSRLVRVYNGLGPQDPPSPAAARTPGLVLGVGRLVEKKGFDLLLDAIAILVGDHPELECVLVGDGDQHGALETQASRLGISDRVTFTGPLPQNEVATWLRRAQIMAAPCRVGNDGNQDALPTVLLEALGAGLPAVTTPIAGIPEIISHGVEGLIVDCDNAAALAAAIKGLLEDPQQRAAMSQAGPKKLARSFDRATTIGQLIEVFRAPNLAVALTIVQICADRGIAPGSTKGAAQHLRGIAAGLTTLGHRVTTYSSRRIEGPFPVPVHALTDLSASAAAGADVIYERYSLGHRGGLELARAIGARFVLEVNSPLVDEARAHRSDTVEEHHQLTEVELLQEADLVVTVSDALTAWVTRTRSGPTVTVANGFEPAWFVNSPHTKPPFPLVFLGHPRPWHGANRLPLLLADLASEGRRPGLLIIGGGVGADQVLNEARPLGVDHQIVVTGPLPPPEAAALLGTGAIGLAPYHRQDPFYFCPLKIVDYLAAGLPIVATDQGDIAALVGDAGVVVDPDDQQAFTRAVAALLDNPTRCADLGRAGRRRARATMTWRHAAARTVEAIAALDGARSRIVA